MATNTLKRRSPSKFTNSVADSKLRSKRRRTLSPADSTTLNQHNVAAWVDNVSQYPQSEVKSDLHLDECCTAPSNMSAKITNPISQPGQRDDYASSTISKTDLPSKLERMNVRDADAEPEQPIRTPRNWEELSAILCSDRATPGATQEDQAKFSRDLLRAISEHDAMENQRHSLLKRDWTDDGIMHPQGNKPWSRSVAIPLDTKFQLKHPQPDVTYAFRGTCFKYDALLEDACVARHIPSTKTGLRMSYAAPHPDLLWPFATAEAKGPIASFAESHLQNQYSAAIMLNNRFYLKRLAHLELPYHRAFIFSINLTVIASVNCHWVELDADGDDVFYTRQLASWNLINTRTSELNSARRGVRNIIEYAKRINFEEVQQDLRALRAVLRPPSVSGQVRPTPVISTVQEERCQRSFESTERPTRSMKHDDDSEDNESDKNGANDDTEENEGVAVGQNDRAVIQYFPDELSNLHSEARSSSSRAMPLTPRSLEAVQKQGPTMSPSNQLPVSEGASSSRRRPRPVSMEQSSPGRSKK